MIMAASCTTVTDMGVIELQNQQIGVTSSHNARQLGGYRIGRKQIKKGSAYLKDLPQELTNEQLGKVNAYFTLLQWCIAARDDLMKDASIEI